MNNNDGRLDFGLGLDTSRLEKDASEASRILCDIGKDAEQHSNAVRELMSNIPTVNIDVVTNASESLATIQRGFDEVDRVVDANKAAIRELDAEYKRLSSDSADAFNKGDDKQYLSLKRKAEAIKKVIETRKEVIDEAAKTSDSLAAVERKLKEESVEAQKAGANHMSLRRQIRALKEEMQLLVAEGIDEQSEAYKKLAAELGRLTDIQGDVQQQASVLANDEQQIAGVVQGLSGLTGAFSAAQGAVGLFAGENEELNKVMLKVQSLMAITMGLQQVQQTLNKDSAFSLVTLNGLKEWWNKLLIAGAGAQAAETIATEANTSANATNAIATSSDAMAKEAVAAASGQSAVTEGIDTAAKAANTTAAAAGTIANIGLAGAFRMVGAAIKSIPVFGWIAAAIAALIGVVSHLIDKAEEAREAANAAFNESMRRHEEFNKAVADKVADQIITYNKLSREYKELGNNLNAQKKFIRANQDAFHGLGVQINNVNDANRYLVEHSGDVIDALMAQARAAAAFDMAKEEQKKLIQLETNYVKYALPRKTKQQVVTSAGRGAMAGMTYTIDVENKDYEKERQESLMKARAERQKLIDASKQRLKDLVKEEGDAIKKANAAFRRTGVKKYKGGSNSKKDKKEKFDVDKSITAQKEAKKQWAEAVEKFTKNANDKVTEYTLSIMEDGLNKELKQIENDTEAKKEAWKEQLRELAIIKQKAAKEVYMSKKNATESGWLKTNDGKKSVDDYVAELLSDKKIKSDYDRVLLAYTEQGERNIKVARQKYADSLIEQFGTTQQRIEKMHRDWAKRISEMPPEYIDGAIEKMNEEFSKLEAEKLKDSINWNSVFNDIDKLSVEFLSSLKGKLKRFLEENKNLSIESIKEITTKMHEIDEAIDKENDTFGFLLPTLQEYKRAKIEAAEAQERLTKAVREQGVEELKLNSIRQRIADEIKTSTGIEIDLSEITFASKDDILKNITDTTQLEKLNALFGTLARTENKVNKSTEDKIKAEGEFEEAQDKAVLRLNERARIAAEGFHNLGEKLNALSSILGELGLEDSGLGKAIKGIGGGISSAASAAEAFAQKDYLGALAKGISALKSFGSIFGFSNGNAAETAKKIAELTASNDALKTAIDGLAKKMDEARGARSIEYYKKAYEAQERLNKNKQEILNAQMNYHAAHHSNAYYWHLNRNSLDQINALLGTALNNTWKDFSKLTAEQMNEIRTHLPDIWREMISQGKYGDRFKEDWNNYADQSEALENLKKQLYENLLDISFDSLRDNFIAQLMDMRKDAASFSSDFRKMMQQALLKSMISNKFDKQLKEWYERLGKEMEKNGGSINESTIDKFKSEYDAIVNGMIAIRDQIAKATGYTGEDESRQGVNKGIATASQDSIDELNGRATAIQGHTFHISEYTKRLVMTSNLILQSVLNIERETTGFRDRFSRVESNVNAMRNTLEDVSRRGIKIQ